jgi:hypothetical protein
MVAALGGELHAGAAEPGSSQKEKSPLPADLATDASQATLARFKLYPGAQLRDEVDEQAAIAAADAQSTASSGSLRNSSPDNRLDGMDSSGKSAKHANSAEKNPAATDSSTAQNTQTFLAMAVPVPAGAALLQLPQSAKALAAQHAQSFLTDGSLAAEHRTAPGISSGTGAAPATRKPATHGILPATVNGNSPAGGPDSGAKTDVYGNGTHETSAQADSSATSAAHTGLQAASTGPGEADTDLDTNTDVMTDANTDAISGVSASPGSSSTDPSFMGSSSAAHTIAAADKRIAEQSGQRPGQAPAELSPASLPGHAPAVQPIGAAGESSTLGRDGAGGHSLPVGSSPVPVSSSGAAAGARETFAAMDTGASGGPAWLHAGAHSAEAGFEDPALGWVSVRAEMAAGSIHASVVPGSAEAAQTLGAHMAGLNNYLSEHRGTVQTLTLASPGGDQTGDQAAGQGTGHGAGKGAGQETSQGNGQDSGYRGSSGQQSLPQSGQQPGTQAEIDSTMPASQSFVRNADAGEAGPARARASISLIA